MVIHKSMTSVRCFVEPLKHQVTGKQILRYSSTAAASGDAHPALPAHSRPHAFSTVQTPLARLTTSTLLRRLLMCKFFTLPILFTPGVAILNTIANSKSRFLNPDHNLLLRKIVKPLIYDQFCAGTTPQEIHQTATDIKSLGFSGVALCYAKEAQADKSHDSNHSGIDADLVLWKNGTLETLDMIGPGDWLGIKITGAGPKVMNALVRGEQPTAEFLEAMDAICEKASKQGSRIWVDAEQQAVQKSIDTWTIDQMRRWNKGSTPLIYNTVQAYLKEARTKLGRQLQLASEEGWTLGVKLVRGAYIVQDRAMIHNTKTETDESYNGIVRDLLTGVLPEVSGHAHPKFELLLCGHNPTSITQASTLARDLGASGKLAVYPEFAQLQGMGDNIGNTLIQSANQVQPAADKGLPSQSPYVPRVYKCLTWGSVQECMLYLIRRAVENRGALDRIKDDSALFAGELRRRLRNTIRFQPR